MTTDTFTPNKSQERGYAIATGLAAGKKIAEIASDLGIDPFTVGRYATRGDVLTEAARLAAATR
jgi:DNA-binding NarL/FixJ family response regulator